MAQHSQCQQSATNLSLEARQAGKSIYTQAWNLPANISGGEHVDSPPALVHQALLWV